MRKYIIRLLPVMLFPYFFLLPVFMDAFCNVYPEVLKSEYFMIIKVTFLAAAAAAVSFALWFAVHTARGDITAYSAAEMNLTVKAAQIPAYVFIILLESAELGDIGIAMLLCAVFINIIGIFFTGILAIGCVVGIRRENVIGSGTAVLMGLFSFIFFVDAGAAAFLYVKTGKTLDRLPPEQFDEFKSSKYI